MTQFSKEEIYRVSERIKELYDGDVISIWNTYCEENMYFDDYIFNNYYGDFNEVFEHKEPFEIAKAVFYGNYNPNHAYFTYGTYLTSFDDIFTVVNCEELADWILAKDVEESYLG